MSEPRHDWERRVARLAPVVGLAILAAGAAYALVSPRAVLQAYLVALAYWWTLAIGGLGLAMLHQLVVGRWGLITSRVFEAAAGTLPVLGLLFVPILLFPQYVYPWVTSERGNRQWLDETAFVGRTVGYFVVWTVLALLIGRWSARRDRSGHPDDRRSGLVRLSAGGLLLVVLTVSFAAIDWFMSLEPEWFSTIYGGMYVIDAGLLALSLGIVVAWLKSDRAPLAEYVTTESWADLGNLLLAFTMLWAYFGFSQFLIIWSGDLPVETVWYFRRIEGWWLVLANANVVLHFVVPFVLLLSADLKRSPARLAGLAAYVLVVHFVHVFWMLVPAFEEGTMTRLLAWPLWVGVGGVWAGVFAWLLGRNAIVPVNDPAADRHRRRVANGHGNEYAHGVAHDTGAVRPGENLDARANR